MLAEMRRMVRPGGMIGVFHGDYRSGAWSEEKANAWADDMLRASEQGRFFASTNFYAYVLRRV